jgi:hypothetical protein
VIKKPEWLRKNLSSEEKVLRKKKSILIEWFLQMGYGRINVV